MQDIKLSDLEKIGVLGSGAFGQVMLVKYEGQYMALKTLSKQQIIEMGLQASCSCLPSCPHGPTPDLRHLHKHKDTVLCSNSSLQ